MRVFITGISSGLGEGIAAAALRDGAEVWGCSRRRPESLIGPYGERLHWFEMDLRDADAGPGKLRKGIGDAGRLDCVVLNAGLLPPIADMRETELDCLRDVMEVNVWANKWVLDVLFESLSVRQVVGISSGASVSGSRGWNGYSLSKAALNMLLKLYAAEQPECHFTAFAPGLIHTAMQDYLTNLPEDERFGTLERLKTAKGTADMPDAGTAGRRCWDAFGRLEEFESGGFVDIRDFERGG